MEFESMPESFEGVKRPVLQQLCKRFGLKANGKNVDMIKALTELQLKLTQTSNNEPAEGEDLPTPGHSVFLEMDKENISMDCSTTSVNEDESRQRPLKKPQKAKRNGRTRKGGRKKPPHSKNSSQATSGPPAPTNPFGIALPMPPHLDMTGQARPNEEGYYTFHWKLKDLGTFNMLNLFKTSYLAKERSNCSQ